jgi:hypothetical protein
LDSRRLLIRLHGVWRELNRRGFLHWEAHNGAFGSGAFVEVNSIPSIRKLNAKEEGMRVLATWLLALGLVASPALAGNGGAGDGKDGDKKSSAAVTKDTSGSTSADSKADPAAKPASLENEVQQLRDLIEAQTKLLKDQSEELKEQQRKMQLMQVELDNVATASGTAPALMNEGGEPMLATPITGSGIVRSNSQDKKEGPPTAIHYKGITLTPGGFFAAETVWRQHGITNDVNTDFKGIPMPGQSAANISEFNFSGRQSRISMKAEGKLADVKLTGYYEADFLGAGTTSNNNQSNSYVYRQRQIWGQAAFESGWKVTGGQMWSLVTETRHGLDNLTEAIPLTIDAQYQVGFSWERQYGVRVIKNIGDKFWVGMSIEGPQTTFGGKTLNDKSVPLTGTSNAPVSTTYNTTLIAAPGDLGGLLNNQANYSYNSTPDFIFKGAWEPGFGHYEVFGVLSTYKSRIFPCAGANALNPCPLDNTILAPSVFGANNSTIVGGGVGGNARWSLMEKKVDLGVHFLGGDGVARYGTSTLADVTVHPDGSLVPIHSYMGMGSLELHPMPKLDIYLYGGAEYDGRTSYLAPRTVNTGTVAVPDIRVQNFGVGYGSVLNSNSGCRIETLPGNQNTPGGLGSCQQDNRNIIEGTAGFWYRFYQGDKGRFQLGMQYSYAMRNTWSANSGGDPHGIENMFFTSMRYYLP